MVTLDFDKLLSDNRITVLKENIGKQTLGGYDINSNFTLSSDKKTLYCRSLALDSLIVPLKLCNETHKVPGTQECISPYCSLNKIEYAWRKADKETVANYGNVVYGLTRDKI